MEAAATATAMEGGGGGGGGEGGVASKLVNTVTVMLGMHLQTGCFKDPQLFVDLCLTLARGIDHAVANNEVPLRSQDLPLLLKQVYRSKNDFNLQAAFMVLMMSVKSACQIGWFADREKDDLLRMARELGGCFSDTDSTRTEPTSHPCIQTIMTRFYPNMKMDRILASFDIKSGYGAHVLDFHISKGMVDPDIEKMWLFVARTDDFDASSCIVSPPEVNFLLNTMGVPGRNKVDMVYLLLTEFSARKIKVFHLTVFSLVQVSSDISMYHFYQCTGPQLPTDVTAMLKYGVNLLQAIGNFNGYFFVAVAVMSLISFPDPQLQDYVEPVSTSVDFDCEVIEMSSKISLNCPISLRRLRTPVKGHLCKHRQCFDFNNYLKINSRRPSWRCPHCNQPVCFPDIRIDRNIEKVLTEVGENIVDVNISTDGSWKPVLENKEDFPDTNNSTHVDHQERLEQCENSSHAAGDHMASGVSSMHQNPSSFLQSSAASLSADHVSNTSTTTPLNTLWQSPVQTDVISQTRQEYGRTQAVSSSLQNQMFSSHSLQSHQPVYSSSFASNEFWRFAPVDINRPLDGYPVALQPPPGYHQTLATRQRNLDPSMPAGASYSMSPTIPSLPQYDTLNRGMGTQLNPASAHVNAPSVPAPVSYPMQHHLVTQGIGGPARNSGVQGTMFRSPSMQQTRPHPYHLQSHPPQVSNNYQNVSPGISHARPQEVRRDGAAPLYSTAQRVQSTTPSVPAQPSPSRTSSPFPSLQSHPPQVSNNYQNVSPGVSHARPQEVRRDGPTPLYSTAQRVQSTRPSVPVQPTPSITSSPFPMPLPMVSERLKTLGEQQQNKGVDGLPAMQSEAQRPTGRMRGSLTGEAANAYRQFILRPPQQFAGASQPALNQMPVNPNTASMPWVIPNITFNPASNVPGAPSGSAHTTNLPPSYGSLPAR